jgi:vacuolar protein-sorting-associated protein 4
VRLLFKRARRHKPAIIFFDEIDAMCSTRKDDSADHESRLKNEFLVQMDGLNHDNSGVLFLAATNLPWKIDPAFIRRFQKRIEVPLPNEEARVKLFEIEIGSTLCNLSLDDYKELARKAEGFSGSDIKTVVQDALNYPVKRVIQATHFSEVSPTSLNGSRTQELTLF